MSGRACRPSAALPTRLLAAVPALFVVLFTLAGCGGAQQDQTMLDPAGVGAQAVDVHWWTMLIVGTIVWVIVVALMLLAVLRRRSSNASAGSGRRATLFVAVGGAIIPALIIGAITVQSLFVTRATDPGQTGDSPIVEVTGHQYWWEVRYPDSGVVDANEIHMPAGQRVQLEITADDVIHSLWVPSLSGKVDMVPGTSNTMWLETDTPGTYWGQCAEYCGVQHALMRLAVVVHEPTEYEGWLASRAEAGDPAPPAASPATGPTDVPSPSPAPTEQPSPESADEAVLAQGREVFMSSSCVYCHAVAGTEARGTFGPDLTHLAGRQSLGAGILPNNRGNLAAWIVDPQSIKPGNEMPGTDISGPELQVLLTYLESLE